MQSIYAKNESDSIPDTVAMRSGDPTESSEGSEGSKSAFDLSRLIESIPYPASKQNILDFADEMDADLMHHEMLEELPDTIYNTPTDVSQALGENSNLIYE